MDGGFTIFEVQISWKEKFLWLLRNPVLNGAPKG